MDYVRGEVPKEEGCIFDLDPALPCSKRGLILYRDQSAVILLNRYPYANGHLLVAPARHVGDLGDLGPDENGMLICKVQQAVALLRKHLKPDGLNIGLNLGEAAGAGLADHLHYHIVPRWQNDHNFMTTIADVRSIPVHLDHTFDMLVDDFQLLRDK